MTLTIPLASLRQRLDTPSDSAYWQVHTEDTPERALIQLAGVLTSIPVRLDRPARLRGRVRLIGGDWRDGRSIVMAHVGVRGGESEVRTVWSSVIASAAELGFPEGVELDAAIPADTTMLHLWLDRPAAVDPRSVGRVLWVEPMLELDVEIPAPPEPQPEDSPAPGPLISVLTPVHNPPLAMLEATIDSVQRQSYENWELVLVDDGSTDPDVISTLAVRAAADARIVLERRERGGGISSATNAALELAHGDYVALLDHDDTLTRDALERIAQAVRLDPSLDMLYSDEAVISDDGEATTVIKPGWSPDAMRSLMYTCHVGVYRRSLAEEIGAFDTAFDGCQDYDFVLRLMEHTDRVAHLPGVLYHWRAHAASTAGGDQAKPYAYVRQPQAISSHLTRTGVGSARVDFGQAPGLHRVVYTADPDAKVELLVASGPQPAVSLAAAAAASSADLLVLSWTELIGLTLDWRERVLGYASQPGVLGAAPIVLNADGRILDAGVAIPDGVPLHLLHASPASAASAAVSNVSALDGVLALRRDVLEELGGLDPAQGSLMMIDLCLRGGEQGMRCVLIPDARVQAVADASANDLVRMAELAARRRAAGVRDRFYNADGYRTDRGDFRRR